MTHTLRIVGRPEVATGFALAGLPAWEAGSPEEAIGRVRTLRAEPLVGVILLEDAFYDRLPEDLRRDLGRRPLPMVVPFPGPAWEERPEAAESYIVDLLRQVVGYRVRLR